MKIQIPCNTVSFLTEDFLASEEGECSVLVIGWLVGWLVGWLLGWLVGWSVS